MDYENIMQRLPRVKGISQRGVYRIYIEEYRARFVGPETLSRSALGDGDFLWT